MAYSGLVFPFRHNWDDGRSVGILERWAWGDDVIPRQDRTEQRISFRLRPRRSLEYRLLSYQPDERAFQHNWLKTNQGKLALIPIWSEMQRIPAAIAPGAVTITADTTVRDFDAGGYALLFKDPFTYETLLISAVNSGSLTTEAATLSWARRDGWIVPARRGYVRPNPNALDIGANIVNDRCAIQIYEGEASSNRFGSTVPVQYGGRDTLQEEGRTGDAEGSFDNPIEELDVLNAVKFSQTEYLATDTIPFRRVCDGRAEIAAFLNFLRRRDGRRVPFWRPTYHKDFPVLSTAIGIAGAVRYKANGFRDSFFNEPGYKQVVLIPIAPVQGHTIGEHTYRQIEDCTVFAAGVEQIHFSTAAYTSFNDANMMVCQNAPCRLAANELEMLWETDQTLIVSTRLRRLNQDI